MLNMVAPELAHLLYPDLDQRLVVAYSTVHDLSELITGDLVSLTLTAQEIKEKAARERTATEVLAAKLPPWIAQMLLEYESQETKEARFVKAVDKLLPITTDLKMVREQRSDVIQSLMERVFDIKTWDDLGRAHYNFLRNFRERFGDEFPELMQLLEEQIREFMDKIQFIEDPQLTLNLVGY